LLAATGCTSITPSPSVWTPKPLAPGSYTVLNGGKPVTAVVTVDLFEEEENGYTNSIPIMRQAVDKALAQCPGADALIDVTQDGRSLTRKIKFGDVGLTFQREYTVFLTGIPVKTNQ